MGEKLGEDENVPEGEDEEPNHDGGATQRP